MFCGGDDDGNTMISFEVLLQREWIGCHRGRAMGREWEWQRQERTGGGNVVASLTVPLMKAECRAGIVSYAFVVHIHIPSSLTLLGDGRGSELG